MKPKVMFTVQGEGRGHMTQAISLQKMLVKNGFEICGVIVGSSGRRNVPAFFTEKFSGVPVLQLQSPNFVTKNNRGIRIGATAWKNLLRIRSYFRSARLMKQKVEEWKPDLIVNFYEPVTGLYAKTVHKSRRPPVVCIAHQYLAAHHGFRFPEGRRLDRYFLRGYTNFTAAGSQRRLALSFYPLTQSTDPQLKVVPPLLRAEIKTLNVSEQGYFLCYLVNAGYRNDIERWHRQNRHVKLHVFTDMASEKETIQLHENLFFHQLSDTRFMEKMAGCNGLISSAGFESVCEAFWLGKPVYMVPVEGHFEQLCNAHDALRAGAGIFDTEFRIGRFMLWMPTHTSKSAAFREWEAKAEELFVRNFREVLAARSSLFPLTTGLLPA